MEQTASDWCVRVGQSRPRATADATGPGVRPRRVQRTRPPATGTSASAFGVNAARTLRQLEELARETNPHHAVAHIANRGSCCDLAPMGRKRIPGSPWLSVRHARARAPMAHGRWPRRGVSGRCRLRRVSQSWRPISSHTRPRHDPVCRDFHRRSRLLRWGGASMHGLRCRATASPRWAPTPRGPRQLLFGTATSHRWWTSRVVSHNRRAVACSLSRNQQLVLSQKFTSRHETSGSIRSAPAKAPLHIFVAARALVSECQPETKRPLVG